MSRRPRLKKALWSKQLQKNILFGTNKWQDVMAKKYGLEQTLCPVGRTRKNGG
jgi:hypothetical protein